MSYSREEVLAAAEGLREAFVEAEARNTWSWIADKFYHADATYYCPYGGASPVFAKNMEEIRATHYGRDMDVGSGWTGWSFPITHIFVEGDQITTRWVNRGPGKRPDGSFYETEGVSFIKYGGDGKFSSQYDLFDIGHQMKLCDELKEVGLLDPRLEEEWVKPMKKQIIDSLKQGIPPKE
ncbi:nuclear transport factor 2 family protein [Zhongshania aquimaris]|uniref:Nuclear transport factor 2 family protein n=1 Tax=Zhongshania aquimaris TaxID=2857107 RepID=A0ABS6VWX8_9GAMM|nr:nuclear transport factor 2 family protein [Zhongshania aquimaris]MBW2942190.1 nuclear transport factor 2 family protein [Zhongshania aquimaris]